MNREEEIIDAGVDFTMQHHPVCIAGAAFEKEMREFNRSRAFEAGAKWADKHPKENLVSIEKAKAWVKNAFAEYFGNELANNISDEFRKAMME